MLDASLCNVVGSPMSPPDGQWAEAYPGMQGSVNSRPAPKQAMEAAHTGPSPADEAILRAELAMSARVCFFTSFLSRFSGTLGLLLQLVTSA